MGNQEMPKNGTPTEVIPIKNLLAPSTKIINSNGIFSMHGCNYKDWGGPKNQSINMTINGLTKPRPKLDNKDENTRSIKVSKVSNKWELQRTTRVAKYILLPPKRLPYASIDKPQWSSNQGNQKEWDGIADFCNNCSY